MATSIKFDKRLHDKNFKSGELTRDELTDYLGGLPDLSDDFRYRVTEEEGEDQAEGEADSSAENTEESESGHEQG